VPLRRRRKHAAQSSRIAGMSPLRLLTDGSQLPVSALALHEDMGAYSAFGISAGLCNRGWPSDLGENCSYLTGTRLLLPEHPEGSRPRNSASNLIIHRFRPVELDHAILSAVPSRGGRP
jgi:hypothetical protein